MKTIHDATEGTMIETLRALTRRPTRTEILLTALYWIVLASGHAAQGPRVIYLDAQRDAVVEHVVSH